MGSAIRSDYVESGSRFLLDSVILIDHFNGIQKATDYLKAVAGEACISAITRAEVLTGFQDPNNLQKAREMLDRFHLIVIDAAIADSAAELRREHRWKPGDVLRSLSKKKMYGSPNSNPSPGLGADKENHTSWERYYQVSDCSSSLRNDWYSGI